VVFRGVTCRFDTDWRPSEWLLGYHRQWATGYNTKGSLLFVNGATHEVVRKPKGYCVHSPLKRYIVVVLKGFGRILAAGPLGVALFGVPFFGASLALGQDKPQAAATTDDYKGSEAFEEASRLRVTEASKESLGKVIELCKKALELGLDELDAADAKKMLGAANFQRAQSTLEELAACQIERFATFVDFLPQQVDPGLEHISVDKLRVRLDGRLQVLHGLVGDLRHACGRQPRSGQLL